MSKSKLTIEHSGACRQDISSVANCKQKTNKNKIKENLKLICRKINTQYTIIHVCTLYDVRIYYAIA